MAKIGNIPNAVFIGFLWFFSNQYNDFHSAIQLATFHLLFVLKSKPSDTIRHLDVCPVASSSLGRQIGTTYTKGSTVKMASNTANLTDGHGGHEAPDSTIPSPLLLHFYHGD